MCYNRKCRKTFWGFPIFIWEVSWKANDLQGAELEAEEIPPRQPTGKEPRITAQGWKKLQRQLIMSEPDKGIARVEQQDSQREEKTTE